LRGSRAFRAPCGHFFGSSFFGSGGFTRANSSFSPSGSTTTNSVSVSFLMVSVSAFLKSPRVTE